MKTYISCLSLIAAVISIPSLAATTTTKDLLARLHDANQDEISMGLLAQEKGQTQKVRDFGAHLVKDHTTADAKVLQLAKDENINLTSNVPQSMGETGQMIKSKSEIAKLRMVSPTEFDREFVKSMDQGHENVIAMLQKSKIDDAKAQKLMKDLLPKLEEHRRIAKKLEPMTTMEAW